MINENLSSALQDLQSAENLIQELINETHSEELCQILKELCDVHDTLNSIAENF